MPIHLVRTTTRSTHLDTKHFADGKLHMDSFLEHAGDVYTRLQSRDDDVRDEAYEETWEWPLAIDVVRTVVIVLSTGGPGTQLELRMDKDGYILGGKFVYLPWFDRAEFDLSPDQLDLVRTLFGSMVENLDA